MNQVKPQRTCISCGNETDKRLLVRLVRGADGKVAIDLKGKANGRGAYLCYKKECWEKALKKDKLEHVFKGKVEGSSLDVLRVSYMKLLSDERIGSA